MESFDFTVWSGVPGKEKLAGIVYKGEDLAINALPFKVTAFARARKNK